MQNPLPSPTTEYCLAPRAFTRRGKTGDWIMDLFHPKAANAFGKVFSTGAVTLAKSRMSVAESPHLGDPVGLMEAVQDGKRSLKR